MPLPFFLRTIFAPDELRVRLLKLFQLLGKRGFGHLVPVMMASSSGN